MHIFDQETTSTFQVFIECFCHEKTCKIRTKNLQGVAMTSVDKVVHCHLVNELSSFHDLSMQKF